MAMWIEVTMSDGTGVYARATGGYAPDIMHDLSARAAELMTHATRLGLELVKAVDAHEAGKTATSTEVTE